MFFRRTMNSFQPYYPYANYQKAKINWGSLLTNTQKTVGIINQAIPIFYQLGPIYKNSKTMFKVFTEFNKLNPTTPAASTPTPTQTSNVNSPSSNTPNFFI